MRNINNEYFIKKHQKYLTNLLLYVIIFVLFFSIKSFALTKNNYERFISDGYIGISGVNAAFNPKGQMYRKFGHFIIDGQYTGGDKVNPFYNDCDSRDLAIEAADGDSTYDVYAEIDDEDIDYSYEDDEDLTATDYDRAAFNARIEAMVYGNTYHGALGYGKYNLRPKKNITAFVKFVYDFYKNVSGDPKVGCKNIYDLQAKGITDEKICPMELLEDYASRDYISENSVDGAFGPIWKMCTKYWEYEGSTLETTENIFEHLQDIFMAYVYLKPGVKKIDSTIRGNAELRKNYDIDDLREEDYAAILSMMYERFGGRPINPSKVESGDAIPKIGTGDILATLVNYPDMSIADKIYTYMIEVKYKNNDVKLASWLKEYEDVMGYPYTLLDSDDYDNYMKAYQVAFHTYGQDTANDTLLDYGFVLTPDLFESKISLTQALNKFANTIRSHFGNSSFYNNRHNADYVAKSYAMAKKMCENSAFSDITDIYACDMDVISHTKGFESNMILLADTEVVELLDAYGTDTDTDCDGIYDYKEANRPEEVDITPMIREYCKYNEYTLEETNDMIAKNSKVTMYSYRSNPVLPDSDFDGRPDANDGTPLDNTYNSKNETDNYSNIKIKFSQDYRYFFMDSKSYYEELAEMGLVLSNMASKKNGRFKKWDSGQGYTANDLKSYMFYIGLDNIEEHIEKDYYSRELEDVPYAFGQHDTVALLGKVNNLQKNIITCVIGENDNYKNILAANFDGQLGADGEYEGDYHHIGYDIEATRICNELVRYSETQTADWKKAYWIVGYGTGGSIANLVAKKMIDLKGNREPVFCYTYQAPGTINRNNLDKRIYNVKYHSTFNVINSSDYMMQLDDVAKFSRYGKIKQFDVGFSKKLNNSLIYAFNETNGIVGVLREIGLSVFNNQELKKMIKSSYLRINNMFVSLEDFALSSYNQLSGTIANKINELSKFARGVDKIDEVATNDAPITGGDVIIPDNIYSWDIKEFLNSLFEWCEYFKGCGYESGKKPVTLEGKYNIKNFGKIDVDKGDSLTDDDKEKIKFDCSGFVAGMYALASKDMRANNNSFVNPAEDKLYFRYFYKKDKDGNEIKSESPTAVWRKYNQNYEGAHIDTKFSYAGTANQVAACKDNAIWVYNKDDTKDESIISITQCKDTSKGNSISFKKYVEHYNEIYKRKYDKDPDTSLLASDDDYNKIIKPGDLLFVTESPGHIAIVKRERANIKSDYSGYENYTLEVWHSGTWDNVTKDENGGKYEGAINSLFTGGAKDVADLYIEEIKENGDLVTSVPVYRYKTIAGNKTYYNNAYIFRVLNWEE